ncbi:MAG: hypothetical protein V3W41_15075 [Planctomycetota bacterium]
MLSRLITYLILASAAATVWGQAPAEMVPADVDFYLEVRNPQALYDQLLESPIYRALDLAEDGKLSRDDGLAKLRKVMAPLRPYLSGRLGLGIRSRKTFKFLAVLENPDGHSLEDFIKRVQQIDPDLKTGDIEEYREARLVAVENLGFLARCEATLLWSSDRFLLRRALRRKTGATIADREDWKQLAARANKDQIVAMGRLGRVLAKLEKFEAPPNFLATMMLAGVVKELKAAEFATLHGRLIPLPDLTLETRHDASKLDDWSSSQRRHLAMPIGPDTLAAIRIDRDFDAFWRRRHELVPEAGTQELAEFTQGMNVFFSGFPFADVLAATKPGLELIIEDCQSGPSARPDIKLPGFALVFDTKFDDKVRDRFRVAFQTAIGIVNAGAAEEGRQPMLQFSKDVQGTQILAARFLDDPRDGRSGVSYNIVPAMAFVGSRLIVATSVELTERLVVRLKKTRQRSETGDLMMIRGKRLDAILNLNHEALVDQQLLEGAASDEEAESNIKGLLGIVREFGDLVLRRQQTDDGARWRLVVGAKAFEKAAFKSAAKADQRERQAR